MSDHSIQIELDAQSVWATIRGSSQALALVEHSLQELISQGLGAVRRKSMQPWFREGDVLMMMAGLLPWLWPERDYPQVWGGTDKALQEALDTLLFWGWRDYQVEAVSAAVTAPLGRAIVSVGTGGGKTRICWGIAFVAGGPWRYVVHGRDLVRQAAMEFAKFALEYAPVNIRAYSWTKLPGDGAGLLVDECHQAAARGRAQVLDKGKWGWRIGLSGSALDRTDLRNPMTVGFFGPEAATVGVRQLTEDGHLSPGKVRILQF